MASPWTAVLYLQRAAGNRAVSSMLERPRVDAGASSPAVLRRKCAHCEAEEEGERHVIRRSAAPGAGTGAADGGESADGAGSGLRSYVSQSITGGMPLDRSVRESFESSFGQDFGGVRIHADAAAARAAASVDAHAFTLGSSIWFGRGQYRPETPTGRFLLAHELAHTIQQRGQTPSLQAQLVIGGTTDAAEVSADRAASAVATGSAVPTLGASSPVVRRLSVQSNNSVPGNVNQRIIVLDNGARYRVTRHRRFVPVTRSQGTPTRVTPGADRDRVWIQVEWCQGRTAGTVRLSADVPAQARDLLTRIANVIQSGGDADALRRELAGTQISPSVDFTILQSRSFRLTGSIQVTFGQQGATAGAGRVGVTTPAGTFGGRVEADRSGGVTGTITYEVPLPGEPRQVQCRVERTRLEVESTFTCELERTTPPRREPRTRPVQRQDERTRYVYFHFEQDRIEEARTAPQIALLRTDVGEGYRVVRIEGFTSPEGPMARRGRFRGNTQLAEDRAQAALERVRSTCSGQTPPGCFAGETSDAPATGRGELYTVVRPLDEGGQEVEGRALAEHAVGEFETQPAEARHRDDPAVAAALQRRTTPEGKAEVVYPLLRRAVVTLTKTVTEQQQYEVDIPGRTEFGPGDCPEIVLEAARSGFTGLDFSAPPRIR